VIDYDHKSDKFLVETPQFSSLLQKLTGVKWDRRGVAKVAATVFNANVLSQNLGHEAWSEHSMNVRDALQRDHAKVISFRNGTMPAGWEKLPSPFPLFPHQARAIYALQAMGFRGILGDEMGLGKTQAAITCYRCTTQLSLLVVCPASIKWKWQNDLKNNGIESIVIDGKTYGKDDGYWEVNYPASCARIVNYDLLSRRPELVQDLAKFIRDGFLILDESHYVKDAGSKRTKACNSFDPKHILLLTGTPIRNTIVDMFSQVQLVHPGIWRNHWEFEDRYQIRVEQWVGPRKFLKPVGTRNEGELNAILETIMVRRMKKDVMDLPEKIWTVVPLDFDAVSRSIYTNMAKKWLYDFQDVSGETPILDNRAKTAMEAALRLEQICQGFLGPVPTTLADRLALGAPSPHEVIRGGVVFYDNPKFAWLLELLEDLGQKKVVCFFRFNATLEAVANKVCKGRTYHMLTGASTGPERMNAIQTFQNSADRMFLCQVKIAEGFDLTAAQDVVFWGRDWSPAVNSQAEDRVHRIGQTGTVNIYLPIIKDSIEERLHLVLEEKEGVARMVLGDIRKAIEATV